MSLAPVTFRAVKLAKPNSNYFLTVSDGLERNGPLPLTSIPKSVGDIMRFLTMITAVGLALAGPVMAKDITGIKVYHANSKNKAKTISSPTRFGDTALMFRVENGQCKGNRTYDDCKGHRERSEIADKNAIKTSVETWYAFSILIPKDTPHLGDSGTILAQFQDGKGSGEITLAIEMFREGILLTQDNPNTQQIDDMAPPKPMVIKTIVPNSRVRGQWMDFKIRAVWSAKGDGAIDVWLNGRLVHKHRGKNLNRDVAPGFKFGLYRTSLKKYRERVSEVVPTQTVIFDGVARAANEAGLEF